MKGKKGFQKGHPPYPIGRLNKGWFTKERTLGNTNGFKKGEGIGNNNYAKRLDVRRKISKALKGRRNYWNEGEKHFNWRGGISFIPYSKEFLLIRPKILERDNFTCQLCGNKILHNTKRKFISVHHIDYNKQNNNENNLIALCNFCNSSVNFKREDWINFFNNKIAQNFDNVLEVDNAAKCR